MFDALLASFTYDPIQRIGPLSPHGIGTALGYLAGAWLMARAGERRGIPRAEVYNMATWGAVGAIIGARGFYVLAHFDDFASPLDWLRIWEGGLTMFGGFAMGLAFGIAYMRRYGFDIPTALDAAAPGFVAGVAIGRIGDLFIADHLGKQTTFPLGYEIPGSAELAPGYGPPLYVPGAVVHQTALYDLAGVLVLGFVLWRLSTRGPRTGVLFATFATWYGFERFLIDFTRNTSVIESSFFGLSGSQWAGLLFSAAGIGALVRLLSRPADPDGAATPPAEPDGAAAPSSEVGQSVEASESTTAPVAPEVQAATVGSGGEAPAPAPPAPPSAPEPPSDAPRIHEPVADRPDGHPVVHADPDPDDAPSDPPAVEDHPEIAAAFAAPQHAQEGSVPSPDLSILDQVAAEMLEDALEERAWGAADGKDEGPADADRPPHESGPTGPEPPPPPS